MGDAAAGDTASRAAGGRAQTLGQDGARRRRWLWAVPAAAAVVALVVVLLVLVVGGSGDRVQIRALGAPIDDASAALKDAEELVELSAADAAATGVDVALGHLSCWYSLPAAEADASEILRCGPVAFADSAPGTYWISVPVTFAPDGERTVAAVQSPESRRTTTLAPDEVLVRPSGETPPAAEEVDLERPPAPRAGPGAAGLVAGDAVMAELDEPDDGRLSGVGHRSRVVGWGTTDRVLLRDDSGGDALLAAVDGEIWLVFELGAERRAAATEQIGYAVAAGDDEVVTLGDISAAWASGETDRQVFAVSVPADAVDDLNLVVDDQVIEQSWSFARDERSGTVPAALYRDDDSHAADVGQPFTLPYAVDDRLAVGDVIDASGIGDAAVDVGIDLDALQDELAGIDRSTPLGEQELELRLDAARLAYSVDVFDFAGSARTTTASDGDHALLYLDGLETRWASADHEDFALDPANAVLTLADGTEIAANDVGTAIQESLGPRSALGDPLAPAGLSFSAVVPVWEVPAGIETASVTIRPGRAGAFGNTLEIDFEDGSIQFDLDFTAP